MRLLFLILLGSLGLSTAALARTLDLPVRDPARETIEAPSYRADVLEIRLAPQASRTAALAVGAARRAAPGPARPALAELGVDAVDEAAAALGGARFEPEFRGETPPAPGADGPDLAAFFLVRLPAGAVLDEALERFAALPEVLSADPIAVLPVSVVPDDSLWASAWWLFQSSRADVHAPEAWNVSQGDPSLVIAILDTGVLPYHPDLGGTVAGGTGHMWVNAAERVGVAGVDDDGNGFVDDVSGWDFVDLFSGAGIPAGEDWDVEDPDPNDFAGHGTFVAGFAGAIPDNGIGLPGAAWNVSLMPVRMAWATNTNPLGLVDMSFAAQAIHYAWRNGARVINASWASLLTNGLDTAARAALRDGVTIVAAAGNNNQPHELAEFDDVIAVAATNVLDQLGGFSNRGSWVDLSAPGTNMSGTFVARPGVDSLGLREPSYADGLNGTSFAAPLVSGAAALVHAQRSALGMKPITPAGMRLRLRETADDIATQNPTGGFGAGRLRIDRALTDGPRSQALRTGAATVGAPVVLSTATGETRIVAAHQNERLVMYAGQDGDTSWVVNTPGVPIGHVAAADLGGELGIGFFVGTSTGRIAGYDVLGAPLPGWPITVPGLLVLPVPALGDIDGDGVLEIVTGAGDQIHAWHADGTAVAGFPVGVFAPIQPLALADLDGVPGDEIVAAAGSFLYVIDADGGVPTGWPVGVTLSQPPVVGRIRPFTRPTILAAAGSELHAFAPNGSTRWLARPLGGTATAAPALADLNGDGGIEVLVATSAPALAAFDSLGMPLAALGWPLALPSAASGHPLVGPRAAGAGSMVLAFRAGALYAYDDSARALPGWPRLGTAGIAPTLAELDGDGRSEVLAGTDSRSLFYIHDAGAGTWSANGGAWRTARGNFARSGAATPWAPLVIVDPSPLPPLSIALAPRVNPSRLPVEFRWSAAASPAPGPQRIEIFDVAGRKVATLPLGSETGGVATWNGRAASGDAARAGMYFARLTSGSFHARTRVVLLP